MNAIHVRYDLDCLTTVLSHLFCRPEVMFQNVGYVFVQTHAFRQATERLSAIGFGGPFSISGGPTIRPPQHPGS